MDTRLAEVARELAHLATPPPNRTASQWADANRILPTGSAEPGPWRSSRTPWIIEISELLTKTEYKYIVIVMGAQSSKTELLLNIIGWKFDDDPTPTLYIGPTRKNVESISKDRFSKLLQSVPSLWHKLEKGKRNTITEKFINGVRLGFGWAGSPTELASHPAGLVVIDERSRMVNTSEGSPDSLADARTKHIP